MRIKLIVNPASGGETAVDHLPAINARLRTAGDVDIVLTTGDGDAEEAGRRAALDGYEHLFIAGGDGTLNEVLNGVAQVDGALGRIAIGVVPLGTGNDFATALGIPDTPEAAVDALLAGRVAAVDVGRVNDRCFLNVSAGGFIADVSDAVGPQLKTVLGKLAYLVGGAQVLLDYEPLAVRVSQASGKGVSEMQLLAFAVCNSRLIGGGRLIAPSAVVDDGWLDVCLIHAMPTLDFVALLRRVSSGEHVEDDRVAYFRTQAMELAFERDVRLNTDGQVMEARRCRYEVMPGAARVRIPGAAREPGAER
ncbi:MAG: diacylglycerol kinase family protein [Vicinamibacteraceae bacterium]